MFEYDYSDFIRAKYYSILDSIATQEVPPGAPGLATGIIKDGKVIYTKTAVLQTASLG
ncbi:MAG: hypothetical protein ACK4TA_22210 [Saprospiraceae bacterium]